MKKVFFYLAMALMVLELTYINTKSLIYLTDDFDLIGRGFSVVGALAFSMFTILVMRTSNEKWVKNVFPLFDICLVFCGFNLRFAKNLLDNPVAFALTILLALFTGLITYCLGVIDIKKSATEKDLANNLLKGDLESKEREVENLQTELAKRQNEINSLESQFKVKESVIDKLNTEIDILNSHIKDLEYNLEVFRMSHLAYERSRILKKKEPNRTEEEIRTLEEALRMGHQISVSI